jgi:hypothetical protein
MKPMTNRYEGEIHINPIRILRKGDFNNDGEIEDIEGVLREAVDINQEIADRMNQLMRWLEQGNISASVQFRFADGGYISIVGLQDTELQKLSASGLIELFDHATERDWVKKYGHQFGLVWEGGRAVES